jgi:hypothetical protein
VSATGYYRVCKDRSGGELLALGFTFGSSRLDERMALQHTILSDIKYAFLPTRKFSITRYGDGTWPVFYTAVEVQTAIAETAFHARKEWMRVKSTATTRRAKKILYHLNIASTNGDRPAVVPQLLHPVDYTYCHDVARAARAVGLDFLDVPSVRYRGGECRPVFERSCIDPAPGIETRFAIWWQQASDELRHNASWLNTKIALWNK